MFSWHCSRFAVGFNIGNSHFLSLWDPATYLCQMKQLEWDEVCDSCVPSMKEAALPTVINYCYLNSFSREIIQGSLRFVFPAWCRYKARWSILSWAREMPSTVLLWAGSLKVLPLIMSEDGTCSSVSFSGLFQVRFKSLFLLLEWNFL